MRITILTSLFIALALTLAGCAGGDSKTPGKGDGEGKGGAGDKGEGGKKAKGDGVDVATTIPSDSVSCSDLALIFEFNEAAADNRYVDYVIEVRGKVESVSKVNGIYRVNFLTKETKSKDLSDVYCEFTAKHLTSLEKLMPYDSVEIRCICAGKATDRAGGKGWKVRLHSGVVTKHQPLKPQVQN